MEYREDYTRYQLERSLPRRIVRGLYLRHAARLVKGRAIDFGCGTGGLLRRLPAGSIGFEINASSVRHCQAQGLPVFPYDPDSDGYSFRAIAADTFQSFVMSHVLEHVPRPEEVLARVLRSSERLGIQRVVVIVPGRRGFLHDPTHVSFVDRSFLSARGFNADPTYRITRQEYFPIPHAGAGDFFTHNEFITLFERREAPGDRGQER